MYFIFYSIFTLFFLKPSFVSSVNLTAVPSLPFMQIINTIAKQQKVSGHNLVALHSMLLSNLL